MFFLPQQYHFNIQRSFTNNALERRIFSGIQPTGIPHIGNYLGALKQWVELQDNTELSTILLFCIADLHAITMSKNPLELRKHKRNVFAILEAIGIDTERSIVYEQSTAKFSQIKNTNSTPNIGLLAYPVLQAADILLYKTTEVPVGEDQLQHLELTCTISRIFNKIFSEKIFTKPQALLTSSKKIMSLRNPKQKMSKSDPNPNSRILITDSSDIIKFKISHATTDSYYGITYDPDKRPGIANLLQIVASLNHPSSDPTEIANDNAEISHKAFKDFVAKSIDAFFTPIREHYHSIITQNISSYIQKNKIGTEKAQRIASRTMEQNVFMVLHNNKWSRKAGKKYNNKHVKTSKINFKKHPSTEEIGISLGADHNDSDELPSNNWRYEEENFQDEDSSFDYTKITAKPFTLTEPDVVTYQDELPKERLGKGRLLYEKPENADILRRQLENEIALKEIKKKYNSRIKIRTIKGFYPEVGESEDSIEDIDELLRRTNIIEKQVNDDIYQQEYIQINTTIENKQELENFLDRLLD
ncbi:hypothetical protein PCANB_002923 [Pneumocystis canis]|nr:hypothetical protein PCANB_002923 [Pneumocystis canis]